jgi:hypothetical protein
MGHFFPSSTTRAAGGLRLNSDIPVILVSHLWKSAMRFGPVGVQPRRSRVHALDTGMSSLANLASPLLRLASLVPTSRGCSR